MERGVVVTNVGAIAPLDAARRRAYSDAATAPNTRRAYRSDWDDFTRWCMAHGLLSLPATPETVALYLAALAAVTKVSTVGRHLTAIAKAHRAAGYETPTKSEAVHLTMRGIRRTHGVAPNQKAPAVLAERGMTVTLRRSKGDQEGEGAKKGIPFGRHALTCPVTAVIDYTDMSQISEGPLFRPINRHGQVGESRLGDKAVALVVKRVAEVAGLDPTQYAGHSLRAGLATSAAAGGAQERDIMRQTGHRSVQMLRRYIRDGELFHDNAAAIAGL